jgi:hypothetical protein
MTSQRFQDLSMEALSTFVVFRLSAGEAEGRFELCFTLKLPIAGLPAERDARVSRSIIKDRAAFMSYLRCLLVELGDGLRTGDAARRAELAAEGHGSAAPLTSGLLEAQLRTHHREPLRLHGLRSLIARAGTEEPLPIPDEFREVWAAIEPHLLVPEAQ